MFEEMTYEYILNRALSNVSANVDKRQGSVIYDAIAPACAEIAQMYIALNNVIDSAFADTAPRQYLILKGREAGIEPYAATYSVCRGIFNTNVPIGTRFNIDKINFEVIEKTAENQYNLRCETAGNEGNLHLGTLVPVDYIQGLTSAELTEVIIYGKDEEDTEDFRLRYFEKVQNTAFCGNKASYNEWLNEMEGVGMSKAERGSGGIVNVYVTAPDMSAPSAELLKTIKEKLDPENYEGLGAGIAPIGHIVRVNSAGTYGINVNVALTVKDGYTKDGIKPTILEKLNAYIEKVNKNWEKGAITLYSAQLLVEILNISGIENITSLNINNKSFLTLPTNSLAKITGLEVV